MLDFEPFLKPLRQRRKSMQSAKKCSRSAENNQEKCQTPTGRHADQKESATALYFRHFRLSGSVTFFVLCMVFWHTWCSRPTSYHSAGKGLQHHGQVVQLFLRSILSRYCTEWIDTREKKNILKKWEKNSWETLILKRIKTLPYCFLL